MTALWRGGRPISLMESVEAWRAAGGGRGELVWFDPELPERPLRVWDRVGNDLIERQLAAPCAYSANVGGYWIAIDQPATGLLLRLSHDERGTRLFPTLAEHEAKARRAAEQRVRELEAELRRRPR